jgi:hypothetical protein
MRRPILVAIASLAVAACMTGGTGDDGDDGDDGGACEPERIVAPTAPACAASTRTCLEGCQDAACADACFAAEPDQDACFECLDSAFLACANAAGCQTQWDAVDCCIQGCPDPEADECYTSTCATEGAAYDACLATKDACFSSEDVCFRAS